LESKGARDSFEQCADFIVKACGGAQDGGGQILRRDLQAELQKRILQQTEAMELR
jgi:hypothetical protein